MTHANNTLLNTKQAAEYLQLKPNTLEKYRSIGGEGPVYIKYKRSGRIFYKKSTLDAWIDEQSGYTSTCEYELGRPS